MNILQSLLICSIFISIIKFVSLFLNLISFMLVLNLAFIYHEDNVEPYFIRMKCISKRLFCDDVLQDSPQNFLKIAIAISAFGFITNFLIIKFLANNLSFQWNFPKMERIEDTSLASTIYLAPNAGVYMDLIYTLSLAIIYMHLNW